MKKLLIYAFMLALCSGCLSVMEKAGRVIDGSTFAEKEIALYKATKKAGDEADMEITLVQNKAGDRSVKVSLGDYPMMNLRGSEPDENGEFFLTSLEYLASSAQGWNEYTMELLGDGNLVLGETASLQMTDKIEPVQISGGRIHRYDTRITGAEALTSLRNRHERIVATVEWMKSLPEEGPEGKTLKDFEKYWKPIMLPELVSKKKRPDGWRQEGDIFVSSEDISWNTSYTERLFSEELWPVRNSGTLLRDWEEALSWLYLEYEWENIIDFLSRPIILNSAK